MKTTSIEMLGQDRISKFSKRKIWVLYVRFDLDHGRI